MNEGGDLELNLEPQDPLVQAVLCTEQFGCSVHSIFKGLVNRRKFVMVACSVMLVLLFFVAVKTIPVNFAGHTGELQLQCH